MRGDTKINGPVSNADTTQYLAEKKYRLYTANAAISVGMQVSLAAGDTTCKKVVKTPTTTTTDHIAIGIYEGIGGTGTNAPTADADGTATGLKGKAAITNDLIQITVFGPALALADLAAQWADQDVLVASTATAGYLATAGGTLTAGIRPLVVAKEAAVTSTYTVRTKTVMVLGG